MTRLQDRVILAGMALRWLDIANTAMQVLEVVGYVPALDLAGRRGNMRDRPPRELGGCQ